MTRKLNKSDNTKKCPSDEGDEWTCQKCLTVNPVKEEGCKHCGIGDPFSDSEVCGN